METNWYQWQGDDLQLAVRVHPRAAKDELVGPAGGQLKVRITAPPIDGKANAHLCRFLASVFGVPRSRVELIAGERSRIKRLRIRSPRKLPGDIAPVP